MNHWQEGKTKKSHSQHSLLVNTSQLSRANKQDEGFRLWWIFALFWPAHQLYADDIQDL